MNERRDPEAILATWLDEGPTDLPDVTRRAILTSLPMTAQARRGRFAPWRFLTMNGYVRLAAAALVAVVAVGGAFYALTRGDSSVGGPTVPPTLSPSSGPIGGPTAIPASQLGPATSPIYGYTIGQPSGWTFRAATRQLADGEQPWSNGPSQTAWFELPTVDALFAKEDRYGSLSGPPGMVAVAPVKVPTSQTAESASSAARDFCGTPTSTEPVDVGGVAGVLQVFTECQGTPATTLWATAVRGDRAYHIVWIDTVGGEPYGRAQFHEILATFQFGS